MNKPICAPRECPGCKSKGFAPSVLGPDRCTFCDGTEGGNPPTREEIKEAQRLLRKSAGHEG